MIYLLLDPFEGLLCECGDFAYTREVSSFGDTETDLCDACVLAGFNLG